PMADGAVVAATPASPLAVLGSGPLPGYWRFHQAVAKAQLAAWLPASRGLLVDISGPAAGTAAQAAASGHSVLHVIHGPPGMRHPPARVGVLPESPTGGGMPPAA